MRLYFVQHGEALPKDIDPERTLSTAGRADVERLAAFLASRGLKISRVLQSGKARARQTSEILAAKLAPHVTPDETSGLNPLDDPEPLARRIATWEDDVLLVGHLPFLAKLVSRLVTGSDDTALVVFQPGSMVCLERVEDRWTVVWMLRPELLKQ